MSAFLGVALALLGWSPPRARGAEAGAFDGTWDTVLSCPNSNGALGFSYRFKSTVVNGVFHGEKGDKNRPGWFQLDGTIAADGKANLYAQGLVGAAPFAIGQRPAGTPYGFHLASQFAAGTGSGSRVEGRPCTAMFTRL